MTMMNPEEEEARPVHYHHKSDVYEIGNVKTRIGINAHQVTSGSKGKRRRWRR